jgi:hypothetical protein
VGQHHHVEVRDEEIMIPRGHILTKVPYICFAVGILCLVLSYALKENNTAFGASYITAYMFWLSLGLGGLIFTLIHHATRAGWSTVIRRIAENFMMALPMLGLLAIPIVLVAHDVFEWTHTDVVAGDPMLTQKAPYLNEGFFRIRVVAYLVLWSGLAIYLWRNSIAQDKDGDSKHSHKSRFISPIGIVVYALTSSMAAMDYMMSLDPHWFSTVFGVYYFAGTFMSIFAVIALMVLLLQSMGFLKSLVTAEHFQDLGKYVFAFMVFWTYIAFSQYMLIWYANIPEETYWFAYRWETGWQTLSYVLIFGHFAIPFLYMMSRHVKRHRTGLLAGVLLMLAMHYADMYFLVQPSIDFIHTSAAVVANGGNYADVHGLMHGPHFSILDVTTFLGIGGFTLGVFFYYTQAYPLVPTGDPRLQESITHENY